MSNKKKKKNSNYQSANNIAKAMTIKETQAREKRKNTIIAVVCAAIILVATILSITFCALNKTPDTRYVKMTVKDHGEIILKLDGKTAPITVENFMNLVNDGFYNGLTFHRIMEDFMIQGGDPEGTGGGGSKKTIKGEFSENGVKNDISHERGVISMARSDAPNSASSQFFICNADSPHLNGKYAAFGWVLSGMDVVDSITEEGVKHTYNGVIYDKTKQPVITSIVEITEKEAKSYIK